MGGRERGLEGEGGGGREREEVMVLVCVWKWGGSVYYGVVCGCDWELLVSVMCGC